MRVSKLKFFFFGKTNFFFKNVYSANTKISFFFRQKYVELRTATIFFLMTKNMLHLYVVKGNFRKRTNNNSFLISAMSPTFDNSFWI